MAIKMARAASRGRGERAEVFRDWSFREDIPLHVGIDPREISLEERIKVVADFEENIRKVDSRIASSTAKPHPGLTNTQIGSGNASIEELIRETRKGIYIYDSGFGPMAGTTNVSSMIDYGFLIENGELKHSVKNTMIGTTVLDLLKNIDMASKELLDESGRISPSIRVLTVKVAGGL